MTYLQLLKGEKAFTFASITVHNALIVVVLNHQLKKRRQL
jgi:hypothetical protein